MLKLRLLNPIRCLAGLAMAVICFHMESSWAAMCSESLSLKFEVDQMVDENDFTTNRSIGSYYATFGRDFMIAHRNLKPNQLWFDLGAGNGTAVQTYVQSMGSSQNATNAIAFSYNFNKANSLPSFDGKVKYQAGNFELADPKKFPKADLITDLFGPISYAKDLHAVLQNALDMLKVRGQLYVHATDMMTQFKYGNGEKFINLREFLELVPNIKVSFDERSTYKIVKLKADVRVPRFKYKSYFESSPPGRIYFLESDPSRLAEEKKKNETSQEPK